MDGSICSTNALRSLGVLYALMPGCPGSRSRIRPVILDLYESVFCESLIIVVRVARKLIVKDRMGLYKLL